MFLTMISTQKRNFDGTKYMSFLIKDDELLKKKHNEIWEKVENSLKKDQYTMKNI